MQNRLQQYRHGHHPSGAQRPAPPVEDLRLRLDRMREQRESDEQAGILPAEDSYIYNLPRHQRAAGYPSERKVTSINRPVGKVEWDEGKTLNIKVEVSETGERMYKMDKEDALKIQSGRGARQGKPHGSIIKNDNEPGMKTRGRGRYRGAPRGRGYFRGRGRGGYRGGRKPRHESDAASSTTSDVTENAIEGSEKDETADGVKVKGNLNEQQLDQEEIYPEEETTGLDSAQTSKEVTDDHDQEIQELSTALEAKVKVEENGTKEVKKMAKRSEETEKEGKNDTSK